MPTPPENSDRARGRSAASKPLGGSGTSTASTSSSTQLGSSTDAVQIPDSAETLPKGNTSSNGLDDDSGGFKVTKMSSETVTLNTTWKPRPLAPPQQVGPSKTVATNSTGNGNASDNDDDALEAAAKKHAWKYMLADIDGTFRDAEEKATRDIKQREAALNQAEEEIADQRERHEAERTLAILDELAQESLATQAPEVMIRFHAHADECSRIETEALALVSAITRPDEASNKNTDDDPSKPYIDVLERLEGLHQEAVALRAAFVDLTEKTSQPTPSDTEEDDGSGEDDEEDARVHIHAIFASCGPVLSARIANLALAQELVDTALQNVTLALRMESMGIS